MTDLQPDYFERPLAEVDPEVAEAIGHEIERQQRTLEMIASENFVPQAVLECQGSVLTNKYAEGYPGKRYYGGCEFIDVIEQLAIDRAKALFGAEHANVQPHAGAQANTAVYHALLQPGDRIMGLSLPHGGHLSHGMKINVSGRLYDIVPYEVSPDDHLIDMDEVERLAKEKRPKLLLAGWSAYPRFLDFERFREIADEVGALLMVDMAHFAGLVAAGRAPEPGAVRRRRDHDRAQDARRPALRRDLLQGGVRQEDQLGRLPRPAGRPAGARDRGQGGGVQDRRLASSSSERQQRTVAGAQGGRRGAAHRRPRGQRADRRDGRAPRARRPARLRARRPAGRGPAARASASRSTATPCRSTRVRRWSPAACASARRRSPRAACRWTTSTRSARSSPARCSPASRPRKAELSERVTAIVDRYPLYCAPRHTRRGVEPPSGHSGGCTLPPEPGERSEQARLDAARARWATSSAPPQRARTRCDRLAGLLVPGAGRLVRDRPGERTAACAARRAPRSRSRSRRTRRTARRS